jgi:hypothetical protein
LRHCFEFIKKLDKIYKGFYLRLLKRFYKNMEEIFLNLTKIMPALQTNILGFDLPLTLNSMLAEIGTLVLRLGDKRISPVVSLM